MIKKILFVTSLFCAGFVSAQTFQLMDLNDVDISGTTHYEYGSATTLACVKFHVENLTGTQEEFGVIVSRDYVPYSNSDLGVCFGTACYSAPGTLVGEDTINSGNGEVVAGNVIYTDLKISPVTWMWNTPLADSVVWTITVFKVGDFTDFVTTTVVWKVKVAGDQDANNVYNSTEIAGDINVNGVIDGNEIAGDVTGEEYLGCSEIAGDLNGDNDITGNEWRGDVNGDGIIGAGEIHGDTNGNGVIDPDSEDDATSVNGIDASNVKLSAYPNPVSGTLTVLYSVKGNFENVNIELYGVLGRKLISHNLNNSEGRTSLDVSSLRAGVYFYAIKVDGQTIRTERVVVR
jgi:hypothetical protein